MALPSAGGKEAVVIEPGNPNMWMSETVSQRSGNTLVASGEMIAENGTALALDRSAIRITVIGKNHAVEVTGCTSG